jgi:hypothetical protein
MMEFSVTDPTMNGGSGLAARSHRSRDGGAARYITASWGPAPLLSAGASPLL